MNKDWLVGFIEGEGNFHVSLVKNFKTQTWKCPFEFYPILQFRIFLREDDKEVLEQIEIFLGFGKIYKKNLEYNRKKGIQSRDQFVFHINSSKYLLKLKEILLSTSFYSKKKKDMEIFFKILDLKISKKHLTSEGYEEILTLASSMNSGNREKFRVKPLTE